MTAGFEVTDSEELNLLYEKRKYLTQLKTNLKSAKDALPFIDENQEITDLEIETLQNAPAILGDNPFLGLDETLRKDYTYLLDALPPIPNYDSIKGSTTNAMATAGTASVYNQLQSFSDSKDPETRSYGRKYIMKFDALQEKQRRAEKVKSLIIKQAEN